MERNSVLVSGKLGDLFHSLYIPNYIFQTTGRRSVIYMTDRSEPFERGLESTFDELVPIITQQPYCYEFKKWNDEPIQFNTTHFRRSPLLYKAGWTDIIHSIFFDGNDKWVGPWLESIPLSDKTGLVISRIPKTSFNKETSDWYEKKIREYGGAIFLGSYNEFEKFPLHNMCTLIEAKSLEAKSRVIRSADLFMGNQSSPLAMAWALGVERAVELLPEPHPDYIHYEGEKKYYKFDSIRTK
jgi:hypothetical protein